MLLLFIMTLLSCGGNVNVVEEIASLEKEHSETPTTEVKRRLLSQYKNYLNDLGSDNASFVDISQKAARLQVDLNKYEDASTTLKNSIAKQITPDNLGFLNSLVVNHLNQNDFKKAIAQIEEIYPDAEKMKTDYLPILSQLEEEMYDEKTGKWNREKANAYIAMARLQGAIVKGDGDVEKKLFKAAEISRALKKYNDALNIYNYVIDHSDNFTKASNALFYKGYTYDENLKNLEEAKKSYEEFLTKYPDHPLAEDTKRSIENLGKTPEEIINSLKKK